jgi:L-malate glycosyltransferase
MPRVVFIQRRMMHYRERLFDAIREKLAARGVVFDVVYGDPGPSELSKNDSGVLPWGIHVPCRYFLNEKLSWQNCSAATRGADLVIITQENRNLYNFLALTVKRPPRLGFFGHGRNMQADDHESLPERFKRSLVNHVDWWFAYTGVSQRTVQSCGFPPERISNLENAIDTSALREQCDGVTPEDLRAFREAWSVGDGPIGLYIGSLYEEKRIDVLLEAGARMAERLPAFRLLIAGAGPQTELVQDAAKRQPWVRYLGPQRGRNKAIALKAATVMMNPGLVGLGILDAFVAGLPLVTMDFGKHSPEIDYLVNGENGLMTEDRFEAFVDAVFRLLNEPEFHGRISAGAARAGLRYTVDNMANNFRDGVLGALAAPPLRA